MANIRQSIKLGKFLHNWYVYSSIVLLISGFLKVDFEIYVGLSGLVTFPALICFMHRINKLVKKWEY